MKDENDDDQSLPNNLLLQFPLASAPLCALSLALVLTAVREHHQVIVFVPHHIEIGAQQGSQRAQETVQVSQQLFRLQPNHDDQRAHCHLGWNVRRTVQAVPTALLIVAAQVAEAVLVVVCAVLVIPVNAA